MQADETLEVKKKIERANAKAVKCYASGDIDSLVIIFSEQAWQMPPNNPPLIGRAAIHEFWTQAVRWGNWEFTLQTQSVVVSNLLAVERGNYVLRFTAGENAPPGMASFEDRGNYLVHWQLEADGMWRIMADAPVSEIPLPGG